MIFMANIVDIKPLIIFTIMIVSSSGSALHGPCEENEQCGTLDTYCKNGTCVCKSDFVVFYDHCVQLATPHISCSHKSDCGAILGQKGFCKSNKCVCKSFHHFFNKQCVKSKGLDEKCESSHQCYCGHDCNDKIECANGMCACKFGFKKYSRRCIPDITIFTLKSSSVPSASGIMIGVSISRLLTIVFLVIKYVYI